MYTELGKTWIGLQEVLDVGEDGLEYDRFWLDIYAEDARGVRSFEIDAQLYAQLKKALT